MATLCRYGRNHEIGEDGGMAIQLLDRQRQAIMAAAPSPIPDGVDLDAEITELEDLSQYLSRRRRKLWAALQRQDTCMAEGVQAAR